MAPKSILFAASAFVGAALVAAQAAPNWQYIPTACASQCSETVEVSYLCQNQNSGDSTAIYGCFCNSYPSDAATCATCLNENNAAALGALLTSTQTACPQAIQSCFFQCSFDTCPSSDVACQCAASYLENIYNCASCNTANNNAGTTQITDFNSLRESCQNQNYTGAAQSFTTEALPVAQTANYNAPSLTATGGGVAATGDASATDGALAATGMASGSMTQASGAASSAAATSASASRSAASGAASASRAVASGASSVSGAGASAASGAASGAASVTPSGAAMGLSAPALGGLLGFAGAIAALL